VYNLPTNISHILVKYYYYSVQCDARFSALYKYSYLLTYLLTGNKGATDVSFNKARNYRYPYWPRQKELGQTVTATVRRRC